MSALKITKLNVFPIKNATGKLKAFARVVLNDQITLSSLRIYDSLNGLFVGYPNEPRKEGEQYRHVFHPTTKDFKEYVQEEVLAEYTKQTKIEHIHVGTNVHYS